MTKAEEEYLKDLQEKYFSIKVEINQHIKMMKKEIDSLLNEDRESMTGLEVIMSQIKLNALAEMKNDLVGRMNKIDEDIIDIENS